MKKLILACLTVVALLGRGTAEAVPLALDGSWTILDQTMAEGAFFTDTYDWSSTSAVLFTITDLYVASDQYSVYDNGILVFTTPAVLDWDSYTGNAFDSPPFTNDPDVALASGAFSNQIFAFAAGSHSLTIQDIHIPPTVAGGGPFGDGTVAFKADLAPVPEPGTIALLGAGLLGLAALRRKRA